MIFLVFGIIGFCLTLKGVYLKGYGGFSCKPEDLLSFTFQRENYCTMISPDVSASALYTVNVEKKMLHEKDFTDFDCKVLEGEADEQLDVCVNATIPPYKFSSTLSYGDFKKEDNWFFEYIFRNKDCSTAKKEDIDQAVILYTSHCYFDGSLYYKSVCTESGAVQKQTFKDENCTQKSGQQPEILSCKEDQGIPPRFSILPSCNVLY